eukprot:9364896-Ditylum_brightwellii.AAC.1
MDWVELSHKVDCSPHLMSSTRGAVADDPWEKEVLIEKSGDTSITCFQIPKDWRPSKKKASEPDFKHVHNPGAWPEFCYKPSFNPKGKCLCYKIPMCATPVPLNADGCYIVNVWEFHYQGWKDPSEEKDRCGATHRDLFPDSRKGNLYYNTLSWFGMGPERMKQKDALCFYQLLLPMCDTSKSGIMNDPCKSYYSKVEKYTNIYSAQLGLDSAYSKKFEHIKTEELL